MCCETRTHAPEHGHSASCGCGGSTCSGPAFWSKKKRIQMVEHSIECMQSKVKDLKELLQELKAEQ